jgi:Rrf2 family protein
MLTMKAKYGLKALADLARLAPEAMLQTREIAEKQRISKKFLDAIMAELRVAGMVKARKGPGGGFALAMPPSQIFVGDILRVLDGPLAPVACASRTAYVPCADCGDEATCIVRRTMLEVREAIAAVLDRKSLAAFAADPSEVAA